MEQDFQFRPGELQQATSAVNAHAKATDHLATAIAEVPDKAADAFCRTYDHVAAPTAWGTAGLMILVYALKIVVPLLQDALRDRLNRKDAK